MSSLRETLGIGQGGIPGVTRRKDDPGREVVVYQEGNGNGNTKSLGSRLGDVASAPLDLLGVGAQALFGGVVLGLSRSVGIRDPMTPGRKESDKKRQEREKLQRELEGTRAWTQSITQATTNAEQLRGNPHRTSSLAARTLGRETMRIVDGSLAVSQGTPVEVKPVQPNEISLAQKILAMGGKRENGLESTVIQEINNLAYENIQEVGISAVNSIEAARLRQLRENATIKVTKVGWGEALLAAVLGASGRKKDSIRGGYEVMVNRGTLALRTGGDVNQIAPPAEITVDVDVPKYVEAALAVAEEKVPLFTGKFSGLIRKLMGYDGHGNVPLKPGRVDIGQTGNEEKLSFPALQVDKQRERITQVRSAGEILDRRLSRLQGVSQETQEQMIKRLGDEAIEGVQKIPRKSVVMELLGKITPDEQFIKPEVVVSRPVNPQRNQVSAAVDVKTTPVKELTQIEKDLLQVGISNMNERTAKVILGRMSQFKSEWIKQFGPSVGRRIARNVERRANSVLQSARKK